MLKYSFLKKKSELFKRFTGLTVEEFDFVFEKVKSKHPECEKKRLGRKDRQRAIGAGRPFSLDLRNRLLMLLVYYRMYTTCVLTSFLFGIDAGNVCRDIKMLEPLVKKCIPLPQKIHKKIKKIGKVEELEKLFPELLAIVDATEQEIPRPKNKRRRKNYYSGKKKRHTVKTQIVVNTGGLIVHKTKHVRGRKHDYDVYKKDTPSMPPEIKIEGDLGYQGMKKDFPDRKTKLPVKKKKGKSLTKKEKRYNRKLAKERIVVEHSIGKLKQFKILGTKFRNNLRRYDDMFSIVCGFVNLRIW